MCSATVRIGTLISVLAISALAIVTASLAERPPTANGERKGNELATLADYWIAGTDSGDICYNLGSVGIGLTDPDWNFHSYWTNSTMGAVYGQATNSGGGSTVQGVQGRSAGGAGIGVYGIATNTGSGASVGVYGQVSGPNGVGVSGYNGSGSGTGSGVQGLASGTAGTGVFGSATSSTGYTYGVRGVVASYEGYGGYFENTSTIYNSYGIWAKTSSPTSGIAVMAQNAGTAAGNGAGIVGQSYAVSGVGVYGDAAGTTGVNYGLRARSMSASGYAGYFDGNVHVNGTLTKSVNNFKIDHPLDPQNKYLSHASVESPEVKNIYNGIVEIDADGNACVRLPDYFEALNQRFRYQLTAIGAPSPMLHVSKEIADNVFCISGGLPGTRVSWQVTGIRHDRYILEHPLIVEEEKLGDDKGRYLQPTLFGQPSEAGIHSLDLPIRMASPETAQPMPPKE